VGLLLEFLKGGAMGRKIRTREGFIVDSGSGEVIDDKPLESSGDVFWSRGLCADEERVEEIINSIVPGLVEVLKAYLRKRLCDASYTEVNEVLTMLWSGEASTIFRKVLSKRHRSTLSIHESKAFDLAGLAGLAVYRCLKSAGHGGELVVEVLAEVSRGVLRSELHNTVNELLKEFRSCRRRALVRWISRPLGEPIDVEYASKALGAEVRTLGKLSYITAKVLGLGVQITSSKVDISSKADEPSRVVEVVEFLSRRLGVELSKPLPVVATIVIKLPFKANLSSLATYERGEHQGTRVKIERGNYTALVYPTTVNIYARLGGVLDKIESAVADLLPTLCTHIEKS
jgi:hypothetical protein